MRPMGAQLLQTVPVFGLPRINHRLSFNSIG
jgi:hypothetical protein